MKEQVKTIFIKDTVLPYFKAIDKFKLNDSIDINIKEPCCVGIYNFDDNTQAPVILHNDFVKNYNPSGNMVVHYAR